MEPATKATTNVYMKNVDGRNSYRKLGETWPKILFFVAVTLPTKVRGGVRKRRSTLYVYAEPGTAQIWFLSTVHATTVAVCAHLGKSDTQKRPRDVWAWRWKILAHRRSSVFEGMYLVILNSLYQIWSKVFTMAAVHSTNLLFLQSTIGKTLIYDCCGSIRIKFNNFERIIKIWL